ncbi:MAG TPA: hypothetical protein VFL93_15305 [Longimicrobiaceae bacterium]|jgi:hypothetical protein|nr:hypothetical protein [Longimicrobiaceae bacterium]
MHCIRDFRPDLRDAVDHLQVAGLVREAYSLAASLERAYPTSSEMLSDIGRTILRVERGLGTAVPADVEAAFQRALAEIRKIIPSLN